jgi:hypothetical protein
MEVEGMQEQSKKDNFYFWENKIRNIDDILFSKCDKEKITRESVIIYIGILDKKKGLLRSGWSVQEDFSTALGFIKYVFLPTAFYTWIDRESNGFFIPLSPFDILKEEVLQYQKVVTKETSNDAIRMERAYHYLNTLGRKEDGNSRLKLDKFTKDFNKLWNKDPENRLFLKVFSSAQEIVDFIFDENVFEEFVEEEIEMSKAELENLCQDVYTQPFINRNFINILNNKIPVWF